jgi:hypothetical protein
MFFDRLGICLLVMSGCLSVGEYLDREGLEVNMVKREKGLRWMPRSYQARKAVVSCDNLRGGANILRSAGSRMG